MNYLVLTAAIATLATSCVKKPESNLNELIRNTGNLYIQPNGGAIRFGEVAYTIYESGRIDMHGDVSFVIPGTHMEIDMPFNKSYTTNHRNVFSNTYVNSFVMKNEFGSRFRSQGDMLLPIDRLNVAVTSLDVKTKTANLTARIARKTHWSDAFYDAEKIDVVLDVSKDIVRIVSARVYGGRSYFDTKTMKSQPENNFGYPEYTWEENTEIPMHNTDDGFNGLLLTDQKPVK